LGESRRSRIVLISLLKFYSPAIKNNISAKFEKYYYSRGVCLSAYDVDFTKFNFLLMQYLTGEFKILIFNLETTKIMSNGFLSLTVSISFEFAKLHRYILLKQIFNQLAL